MLSPVGTLLKGARHVSLLMGVCARVPVLWYSVLTLAPAGEGFKMLCEDVRREF